MLCWLFGIGRCDSKKGEEDEEKKKKKAASGLVSAMIDRIWRWCRDVIIVVRV